MTCAETQELFEERLDGPLPEVDAHLAACPSCAASYRELCEAFGQLKMLSAPPAPRMPNVLNRLHLLNAPDPGVIWERRLLRFQGGFGKVVAAAFLCLGLWLGANMASSTTKPLPELVQSFHGRYLIVPEVRP